MKVLADTHVGVCWLAEPERLEPRAREILADPGTRVFFSTASLWEIELKLAKGKLDIPDDYWDLLRAEGFEELPVRVDHVLALRQLPAVHADPFDRMLVAQARVEGLVLASRYEIMAGYGVPLLHA